MANREDALEIFLAGVDGVKPDRLIKSNVKITDGILYISDLIFDLSIINYIFIVGAGKASAMMAKALEDILGSKIKKGHIITKYNHGILLSHTEITEAGHPVPDENGLIGTQKVLSIVNQAAHDDLVIVLMSGGCSSLLTDIPEKCTLNDIKLLNDLLLKSGATINEINCIRKHLSKVKGGQLAKAITPATTVSLILSDVINDPLDVIGSGPTAPDPTSYTDAFAIISKYGLNSVLPVCITETLQEGIEGKRPETLKFTDSILINTHNLVIGNNTKALISACEKAESLGYLTQIVTNTLEGDTIKIANDIVNKAKEIQKQSLGKKCLLYSGEPTLKVEGKGLGGRNQHLVLVAAQLLADCPGITILSGGTDGTDGPTDAAGAVCDSSTYSKSLMMDKSIKDYLINFDSYHFFEKEGGLIITGPTQTNVMDMVVVLIDNL